MATTDIQVRESGVELRLETTAISARCDGRNRLTEIEIFCGSETEKISADCFVDASGGAFLLRMAGAQVSGESNYVSPWFMEFNEQSSSRYHFSENIHIQVVRDTESSGTMESVLTAEDIQRFLRRQYEVIRSHYDRLPEELRKKCYPLHLPGMAQLRKIARIAGLSEITDGGAGTFVKDSVGVAADWRKMAPSWETPYGALLPEKIGGALAAGRCIASWGEAWEIFRVIPAAAMTGEAAGTAAALASIRGIEPAELPVKDLQNELIKRGSILHIADARR